MPSGRDAEQNGTVSSRHRPENSEEGALSDDSGNTLGINSMQQSDDGSSELRLSHHSDNKKKNKRKQREADRDHSSKALPIVEYSDVSSEDLSAPEAGEIQSEDGFNLSDGEVSPQLQLSMRHHSDSHRHSSSSSSKHHRDRKASDPRYLSPSPSEARHTHRRASPSAAPSTPSPPPKGTRHKESSETRHRKHRDHSPSFQHEASDSPPDYHSKNDILAMRQKGKKHKRDRKHEKTSRHPSPRKRRKKSKHRSRDSSQAATSRNVSPPSAASPDSPDGWERSVAHKHHSRDSSQTAMSRNVSPPGMPGSPRSAAWERPNPLEDSRLSFRGTPRTPPIKQAHGPSTSPVSPPSRGGGSDMDIASDERDSPSYPAATQRRRGSVSGQSPHTPPVPSKGYESQLPRDNAGGRQTPPSPNPNRRHASPNYSRRSRSPEGMLFS